MEGRTLRQHVALESAVRAGAEGSDGLEPCVTLLTPAALQRAALHDTVERVSSTPQAGHNRLTA